MEEREKPPPGKMWIYRPYRIDKSGKRIYAHWYGKKVFRMLVDE
jgi:hypothetical protein